ncbi:unnamed protein product [Sphagnum jensenii]|uniref:Uncharacterized protein n=1 Tax=Sphagnum jensenii TaxID=128206 RepID=A0ABP0W552_9BRYO
MTIGEKKKEKSSSNLLYLWSPFTSNNNDIKSSNAEYQTPADIEEQMQLDFALWRSGSTTYGGSSEPREEAELHFDDRRAVATVGMPGGLSFLVDPPGVCKKLVADSDIQEWIHFSDRFYKVQVLPLHNRLQSVELSPNEQVAECTDPKKLDLLLSNVFNAAAQEEPPRTDDIAEHLWSTKLKRLVSQKRTQEILEGKLRIPLQECMKELRSSNELAQVLEALAMFCSHYQSYLQVLSSEPAGGDEEEGNQYDDRVMLEAQIQHLDRGFQALVCEQVNDAAAACQVAAQVVAEVSRLAASMLTGDGFSLPNTTYQNAAALSKRTKQVLFLKDMELSFSRDLSSSQQDPATNGFPLPNTTYQNAAAPSKCTKPVLLSKDTELSCSLDLSSSQQDPATIAGLESRGVQDFMIVPRVNDDDMASDASWVKEVDGDTESESSWKDTVLPRSASNTGLDGVRMTLPSGNHTKGISMLSVGAQQTYDYLSNLLDSAYSSGGCSKSEDGPGHSDFTFCKPSNMERISPDLNTRVTSMSMVEASPETSKKPSYAPPKSSQFEQYGMISTTCPEEPVLLQQQIAALCWSANQKAVLEGNVLQWCSVKLLKECYTIQIVIQVAEFMEDDLALWTTGISLTSPLVVEIALEPLDFSQTLMAGAYQVCAYQGTYETRDTEPLVALAAFIPHVVRWYLGNAQQNGAEHNKWLDHSLLIGLMKHIVHSLAFLKYKCVICGENHFDLGHRSSLFPQPCAKNLCTVLFRMWMIARPKKILTLANIKTWLLKKYKCSNRTDMTMLEDELKKFHVDSQQMKFQEKIQMLALMISCKAKMSWVEVSADEAPENPEGDNTADVTFE